MKFILTILFIISAVLFRERFNNTSITEIEQEDFPNAVIYCDSIGHQYIKCKLAVVAGGFTGEIGTPMEGKYLVDLSGLDNETLEYIITLRNYKLAEKKFRNKN